MGALFTIDHETCARDGICAKVCPAGLIDLNGDGYPLPVEEAEEVCIRCGHCVAVCPTGSFRHRDMPPEQCPDVQDQSVPDVGRCEYFFRSRRSIRVYKDEPVAGEDIARLIEIARYAPSGHNSQCVEWLVIQDREELRNLSAITVDWMRWVIREMPELAQAMHMDRTVGRWEAGHDVILRGAPALLVTHAGADDRSAPAACTIALAYLELAAWSMGLGCCWAGYFNAAAASFPSMGEALSLPKGHQCFGAMMLGHPMYEYRRLPLRHPPRITWR